MADEFQIGSGNWWDSSRNRFDSGSSAPSTAPLTSIGSFGWATEMVDIKARSSMDSGSVSRSLNVFQDTQKLQGPDSATAAGELVDSELQLMGLGLSSPAMDWNQSLLRSGKAESSFRSLLQEDLSSNTSYQQQENQPQLSSHISSGDSTTVTCPGLTTSFQMDSAVYGSTSTMLQGFVGSDNQPQQSTFENGLMNYQYPSNYGMNSGELLPSWSKFPQFIRTSPPKQPPHNQLHFANNAPFWNASAVAMNDARSSFFPSLQTQFPTPNFDEKPKNSSEVRDLGFSGKKK
ncbi:hypothetical protein F0562_008873 [Nyssa sinensis]|uniref:Uncharacterized protein n=1 Tax=Nyssa sinensis TaxID=561372 RepID=A0A5J5AA35_9ASTE|nr:hypothetical protein F0562_008873 [Nyssa sinensis]